MITYSSNIPDHVEHKIREMVNLLNEKVLVEASDKCIHPTVLLNALNIFMAELICHVCEGDPVRVSLEASSLSMTLLHNCMQLITKKEEDVSTKSDLSEEEKK